MQSPVQFLFSRKEEDDESDRHDKRPDKNNRGNEIDISGIF